MLSFLNELARDFYTDQLLWAWLGLLSILMFFGTLLIIPWLILKIPDDYFLHDKPGHLTWQDEHPVIRIILLILKNLLGLLLLLAGIAMLVLPGQGLLTILLAVILLDFPGKYRLKLWLVRKPRVLKSMNWLRRRYRQPPLRMPAGHDDTEKT